MELAVRPASGLNGPNTVLLNPSGAHAAHTQTKISAQHITSSQFWSSLFFILLAKYLQVNVIFSNFRADTGNLQKPDYLVSTAAGARTLLRLFLSFFKTKLKVKQRLLLLTMSFM